MLLANAGGEFYGRSEALNDKLFIEKDGNFQALKMPENYLHTSIILKDDSPCPTVFGFGHAVSNDFGKLPNAYMFSNDCNAFSAVENDILKSYGMVTDAIWFDMDGDGTNEIITVGEWMPPRVLKLEDNKLKDISDQFIPKVLNGLWQSITSFDLDNDGQEEIILGNFGENTKFKATPEMPLRLYYSDFDANNQTESIVCLNKSGKYFPINTFDELSQQMPMLKKKFNAYKDFAGKPIDEIFETSVLEKARILEVHTTQTGYLKQVGGKWNFFALDDYFQLSPITAFQKIDLTNDGIDELLFGGNYFGLKPFHGRLGSFLGGALTQQGEILDDKVIGVNLFNKAVVNFEVLDFNQEKYLIVVFNDSAIDVYKMK